MMVEGAAEEGMVRPGRAAILDAVLTEVAFEGWTEQALARAERSLGVPAGSLEVLHPGGVRDFLALWADELDREMEAAFPPERLAGLKVRERITELVFWRIGRLMRHREAVRRLIAHGLLPWEAARLASRLWGAADSIWRLAGDTATDINHYTKRAILSGVLASTLLVALDDTSPGLAETRAFLDRRIADVMRIERCKAAWRGRRAARPSLTRFLGRLRYPPERA